MDAEGVPNYMVTISERGRTNPGTHLGARGKANMRHNMDTVFTGAIKLIFGCLCCLPAYILMLIVLQWSMQRIERAFIAIRILLRQKDLRSRAEDDPRRFLLVFHSYSHTEMLDSNFGFTSTHGDVPITVYTSIVEEIETSLGQTYPILALGSPYLRGPHAIRIWARPTTWKALAQKLIEDCRAIILIPESSDGLIEEAGMITKAQKLTKTLVLMPPFCSAETTHWYDVRARFAELGLNLPEYRESGLLYLANEDLSIRKEAQITDGNKTSVQRIQRAFDDLISSLPGEGSAVGQVLREIRGLDAPLSFEEVYRTTVCQWTIWPRHRRKAGKTGT